MYQWLRETYKVKDIDDSTEGTELPPHLRGKGVKKSGKSVEEQSRTITKLENFLLV
jgi:hypothetical protein